jgi:hypothetical protein
MLPVSFLDQRGRGRVDFFVARQGSAAGRLLRPEISIPVLTATGT